MKKNKRSFGETMKPTLTLLATLLLAPLAVLHAAGAPPPPAKPNILWIIMDDVGAELPCYGEKKIQTPNMDRLVREGTRFDRAFLTASVCSPSRSAMITGMYQTTIGAHHQIRSLAGDSGFRSTLEGLRNRLDRWMAETRDCGPESGKAYDANVAYELNAPSAKVRGNDAVLKNVALMKQWAKEGK